MKYAVMTTWKHTNAIDWDGAEASIGLDDLPEGTTIQWFAIDEHNHGSFVTFVSKEAYEQYIAKIDAYRKEKIGSRDTEMTMEAVVPIQYEVEN